MPEEIQRLQEIPKSIPIITLLSNFNYKNVTVIFGIFVEIFYLSAMVLPHPAHSCCAEPFLLVSDLLTSIVIVILTTPWSEIAKENIRYKKKTKQNIDLNTKANNGK